MITSVVSFCTWSLDYDKINLCLAVYEHVGIILMEPGKPLLNSLYKIYIICAHNWTSIGNNKEKIALFKQKCAEKLTSSNCYLSFCLTLLPLVVGWYLAGY